MISPMIFANHPDTHVFAEALRVAADVVERGEGQTVEFLGRARYVRNVEGTEVKIFFLLHFMATGETKYVASDGEII